MDSAIPTAAPAAEPAAEPGTGQDTGPDAPARRPGRRRGLIRLAVLLLLVPTAVTVCRAADTDAITPVPQLLAFLPWLLLPAGAALAAAVLARWRSGVVWAAAVLAVTGWFVRPYDIGLAGTPPGPVTARFEVLTSNVEFGNATEGLLTAIRRERPDLVFVQECAARCSDGLAARVPLADYPYRNVVEGPMASGSAILSKYPLRNTPGIESTLAMPGAVARIAGQEVRLQLAHPLPPIPGGVDAWRSELGRMSAHAAKTENGGPAIVAGDFNATPDHAAFRRLLDAGGLRNSADLGGASRTPSWPTMVGGPLGAQIDHVLISREFAVSEARFLELGDTDHRSLLVGLELHDTGRP
ncbi:endonuclease/exonuclease/phosphatase family protein [Streptomyces amakusaensis]|uniref:Endonuclease/exonuclease/phosphatase family protein n=1 Tax=Streptomyces amakusaensis TaxID=67271 RepID=A0ABW0AGU4_9ACTN